MKRGRGWMRSRGIGGAGGGGGGGGRSKREEEEYEPVFMNAIQ
jgi:hypothetical protein